MKRFCTLGVLLIALTLAGTVGGAQAENATYDGIVAAGRTQAILSTVGGTVETVAVQAGDRVQAGDVIMTVQATRHYAADDGTVTAVFAEVGDDMTAVTEQYGAALVIAPQSRFTAYVTGENAYESVESMYAHTGETVYFMCTKDGTHQGIGRITAIDASMYTVEMQGGEFFNGEAVYAYSDAEMTTAGRIGKGTVVATESVNVTAAGILKNVYVQVGDFVEKGQLLFETLDAENPAADGTVTAAATGIITAINAAAGDTIAVGSVAAVLCPADELEIELSVDEYDAVAIHAGDPAKITVLPDADTTYEWIGTVRSVSYLPVGMTTELSTDAAAGDLAATSERTTSVATGDMTGMSGSAASGMLPSIGATDTAAQAAAGAAGSALSGSTPSAGASSAGAASSASAGVEEAEQVMYTVRISFSPTEDIAVGMSASVVFS